jgi:hypothetical protein
MHNVTIDNDNANWSRWGDLVSDWITGTVPRPTTVGQLRAAMTTAGIHGAVQGAPNRAVNLVNYNPATGPIIIPLPTAAMVAENEALLNTISMRPIGQRRYPLPTFYAVAFGGAAMVDLSQSELHAMGRRRLGECVINEGI